MSGLEKYLAKITPQNPDLDKIFGLRKHILSRYPDLERAFTTDRPAEQKYIDLFVNTHLINTHISYMASQATQGKSIELPHKVLSKYLRKTEELTKQLAKDPRQEGKAYSSVAKSIVSREPDIKYS